MRKLLWLAAIALLAILINFGLWFWHTRLVIAGVDNARYQLRTMGIDLQYEDLKFTNFKAWELYGKLNNVTIRLPAGKGKLQVDEIQVFSAPLEHLAQLTAPRQWQWKLKEEEQKPLNLLFTEEPTLEVHFKKSLRDFNRTVTQEVLGKIQDNAALATLKHLVFHAGPLEVQTPEMAPVLTWKEAKLEVQTWRDQEKSVTESTVHVIGYKTDLSMYFTDWGIQAMEKAKQLSEQVGETECRMVFRNIKVMSEHTKAALKQRLGEDLDLSTLGATYDSEYNEDEIFVSNEKFKLELAMTLPRSASSKKLTWSVDIASYHNFIQYFISAYNAILEGIAAKTGIPPIFISEKQNAEIIRVLASLEKEQDTIAFIWVPFSTEGDSAKVVGTLNQAASVLSPNISGLTAQIQALLAQRKLQVAPFIQP